MYRSGDSVGHRILDANGTIRVNIICWKHNNWDVKLKILTTDIDANKYLINQFDSIYPGTCIIKPHRVDGHYS